MGTLLNDHERTLFDATAVEIMRLAGVDCCVLWHFTQYPTGPAVASVSGMTVDCLYGEPLLFPTNTNPLHYTPYRVLAFFQEPTFVIDATDAGELITNDGRIFFSRRNLEDLGVPINATTNDLVGAGDIIQLFTKRDKVNPYGYWYFDLKNIQRVGWVNDSRTWTHYQCDMVRNSNFTPEQIITGSGT